MSDWYRDAVTVRILLIHSRLHNLIRRGTLAASGNKHLGRPQPGADSVLGQQKQNPAVCNELAYPAVSSNANDI
jgi:hypothetical protein